MSCQARARSKPSSLAAGFKSRVDNHWLPLLQVAEVTEAVKEAKDAKKDAAVDLERGADTVVGLMLAPGHSLQQ